MTAVRNVTTGVINELTRSFESPVGKTLPSAVKHWIYVGARHLRKGTKTYGMRCTSTLATKTKRNSHAWEYYEFARRKKTATIQLTVDSVRTHGRESPSPTGNDA